MTTHSKTLLAAIALVTVVVACGGDDSTAPTTATGPDDAAIIAMAKGYASLKKVTDAPFKTQQHQGNSMVNVYVNSAGEAAYAKANASSAVTFPEGSMVIKEMLDASGKAEALTVLYKMKPGYDPDAADWWRARLTTAGVVEPAGVVGKVGFCAECHKGAQTTDRIFGVTK